MKLQGNLPVIPTPFLNGEVEYEGFDRLFEHCGDHVDGFVICGSTGEAPSLTVEERIAIVRYAAPKIAASKKLIVGLGHTSLEDAVRIGTAAAESGVRTALVPSPYYFPNSPAMVTDYIGNLAERTGMEIVFYDNPVTTKTHFTSEQLLDLLQAVPRIQGVKMTDHAFDKIRLLKANTNAAVFGGDDIICFRAFEAGVDGSMIIAPIIFPAAFQECWEAYRSGKEQESFFIYSRILLPFINMFGPGDEVATTKALFQHLHIFSSAETRSPLLPSDRQRVKEVILGYEQAFRTTAEFAGS